MARFINPFTDVGFKRIFGQEINKDLLIDFLNALLEGEKRVKDIRFLDKELLPEYENDRSPYLRHLLHGRKRRTIHRRDAEPRACQLP